jgi:PAS domain S-box-containing protein
LSRAPWLSAQTSHARQFLAAGFLLLALVVVFSFWFARQQSQYDALAQDALSDTKALADLLSTMRQAEAGERGYLLTGNEDYLTTVYQLALQAEPGELRLVNAEFSDKADAADVANVNRMVSKKLDELARSIALFQAGDLKGAVTLMQQNLSTHGISRLRDIIGGMQARQARRLVALQAEDANSSMMLQLATWAAVVVTLLLAWVAIRENRTQNEQLRAAQAELLETNATLERRVRERTATLAESQAALAESNAMLELRVAERSRELDQIFRLSADILGVLKFDGTYQSVSPAWEAITGWPISKAYELPFTDFLHPDDLAASMGSFAANQAGSKTMNFENRYRRPDGSYRWLAWRAVPSLADKLLYVSARDVTEDKAREERLRQSQKMEVVGQLTGGIAHDFNNLLTIIMGSLELLQRGLAQSDLKLQRRVENAMDGAKRAAALTHRLLAFSRRQPLAPKALDVNRLLSGMSDMLHRTLGEHVNVELVASAGLWPALADGNQLENALLNLAVNARDAMPGGGHLTIETQNAYLDHSYTGGKEVEPGQYVQIAVTDTGVGMEKDVRAKVFEPFFTTKAQGQGTGLGLAQVYGFAKQSGGHVGIYSEPGQGTVVKLYLPRSRAAAAAELPANDTQASLDHRGRGETILLVEDEEGVRQFASEILGELGYNVLTAETAAAGLEIFSTAPGVQMLFTDVVLTGGMNGRQLADEILRRAPDTIVLFTTGYTRNAIIHHGRLDEGVNFIGKPFTAGALAQMIRALFDQAGVKAASSGQGGFNRSA